MNRIGIAIMALLPVVVLSGSAQEKMMTLDESITLGLENSKMLHASLMKMASADAKAAEVSGTLYPSLKVLASYQRLSEVPEFKIPFPGIPTIFPYIANTYSARASFQQPLFTGGRLLGAARSAGYQAEASKGDLDKDKAELVFNIKSGYWNVFRAKEVLRLAEENVKQVSAHLQDAENLLTQGLATTNDVMKIRVQLTNSTILQSDAANNVQLATIAFNSIVGLPLETEVGIASKLTPASKEFPELRDLVTTALTARPDVLAMESRVNASDAAVASAAGGWFPQVLLTGNYYYARPNQRIIPTKDEFNDTWDVGITLQFDLWNNLSTLHQTQQAKAQFEQTKDALAMVKDGVTLDVTQSYFSFIQSKNRIRLSEQSVQQANEHHRMTAEKFKAGLTTSSELLDAEVALLQANLQLTQSLVDHELAEAKLEKAVGITR